MTNPGGRPTKYNEEILQQTLDYYNKAFAEPLTIPYIEELSLFLDIDDDTIVEWCKIHSSFSATIKKIKKLQKIRLMNRTQVRDSATGSIFLLKVNHGMVEANKLDVTSGGKPIPLLGGDSVSENNSTKETLTTEEEN